jgi:hypothetical protein
VSRFVDHAHATFAESLVAGVLTDDEGIDRTFDGRGLLLLAAGAGVGFASCSLRRGRLQGQALVSTNDPQQHRRTQRRSQCNHEQCHTRRSLASARTRWRRRSFGGRSGHRQDFASSARGLATRRDR